jgi:hypothetical protein
MRTYFRQSLADDALLSAAYSAESVLIEIIFIVGPLIVALLVAFAAPAAAVWFAAACGLSERSFSARTGSPELARGNAQDSRLARAAR